MRITYKFRLYPTKKQEKALQLSLDACRWVYNKTIETKRDTWEKEHKSISRYTANGFLPKWKEENPDLGNVYNQCLQAVQEKVDLAFNGFFRRIRAGQAPGYPRFKGINRYNSFIFPQPQYGFNLIENKLRISKVGIVRVKKHREISGVIKRLIIKRARNKWYACFVCEFIPNSIPITESIVGIDVGLTSFATLSNGEKIPNPRFFRTDEDILTKAQSRFDKSEKGSEDRKKQKNKLLRIHEKIGNRRIDFIHKLSRKIVNENKVIVFEKIDIENMKKKTNRGIRKSIADAAWNKFMQFTYNKAEWAGRQVLYVSPWNTSKKCSRCGQIVEKELSDRVHSCSCGLVIDRDHNAAINILALGMQSLAKSLNSHIIVEDGSVHRNIMSKETSTDT